jgi:hypothetical protein
VIALVLLPMRRPDGARDEWRLRSSQGPPRCLWEQLMQEVDSHRVLLLATISSLATLISFLFDIHLR